MSLDLDHDYEEKLQMSKPTFLGATQSHPPLGALGDISNIPPQVIPPINTDIRFAATLPTFKISDHPGLAALDHTKLPKDFNWRHHGGKKSSLIAKPGNQMLCGSCWAISTAGIVADNHVVSGTINWKPSLSTTWSLACYPQFQCKGGNPAKLFQNIAQSGIATQHCSDYSWCARNDICNGKAINHFKAQQGPLDLSALIPNCGCVNSKTKHYLYYIETPKSLSLGKGDMNNDNFTHTVKKHIFYNGPVQGGFVVFNNFRSGAFTKVNGGVYLEDGVYDKGSLHFDKEQTNPNKNYVGSHAIAIIGWGVEKGVVVNNNGTKKDVPYWYCRNSWTEKWGDGGYFKMAMYPYNKISQFDKEVLLNTPNSQALGGGMILVHATKPPELKELPQFKQQYLNIPLDKSLPYYEREHPDVGSEPIGQAYSIGKYILIALVIIAFLLLGFFLVYKFSQRITGRRVSGGGRPGSYVFR